MNRFGLVYETKNGKQYLYKSYYDEAAVVRAIKNDDNFKAIEKEKVFIFRLADSDIKEIKLKNEENLLEVSNGKEESRNI